VVSRGSDAGNVSDPVNEPVVQTDCADVRRFPPTIAITFSIGFITSADAPACVAAAMPAPEARSVLICVSLNVAGAVPEELHAVRTAATTAAQIAPPMVRPFASGCIGLPPQTVCGIRRVTSLAEPVLDRSGSAALLAAGFAHGTCDRQVR